MGFQAYINKDINKVEVYLQKPNSSVTPFQIKIKTPLDDVLTPAEREQKSLDAVRVVPVGDPSPCIYLWGHGNHGFLPSNSEGFPAFVSHHHEHGVYSKKI